MSGWEGADWYAPEGSFPPGTAPDAGELSWGRQDWFPYWEAEHHAAREGVILMDMSFMAKFARAGPGRRARARLALGQRTWTARAGVITYTQWLNEAGKLEADLTVTKLADDEFYVVASDTAHRHAETWMRRHFRRAARTRSSPTSPRPTRSSTSRGRARASCCRR